MTRSIGIGIAGAGFLAETRARCYAKSVGDRARVVAVCARTEASARAYGGRHAVPHVCRDLDEMLSCDAVEVVDLCVPNGLHRSFAVAAARAGKHVICTKPLTAFVGHGLPAGADLAAVDRREMLRLAAADCDAMIDAAKAAGVRLFYGENWLYAPSIVRAKTLLERAGGAILEMRGWESHGGSHSPYAKRFRDTGGGALLRLGSHPIGAMIHLKRVEGMRRRGAPVRPVSVTAEVGDLTDVRGLRDDEIRVADGWIDVENWGVAVIGFDDGSRGVAYGSDNQLGGMESRLDIHASNCHMKCNMSPNDMLRAYAPDRGVFGDAYIMEKLDGGGGWSTPIPDEDWSSGQLAMCEAFVTALHSNEPDDGGGELGRDVVEVVYAAYVSAGEGRRVDLSTT